MPTSDAPIGIFDSGVGGLSVMHALRVALPHEDLIYIADQANVPYGPRPMSQVRSLAEAISRYLISEGAKLIVVACNTASTAALHSLRRRFPDIPFVGMEPAVKPAATKTSTGKVGVLATPATFQGALYASLLERFAQDVTVYQHTCPGLVTQIEAGQLSSPETREILEEAINPMADRGVDAIVLGCTHYPFVIPLIQEIAGPAVKVIDPSPAVARQTGRVLESTRLASRKKAPGALSLRSTGDPARLAAVLPVLLPDYEIHHTGKNPAEKPGELLYRLTGLTWKNGRLQAAHDPADASSSPLLP